jgi:uncharacterized protein DUF1559
MRGIVNTIILTAVLVLAGGVVLDAIHLARERAESAKCENNLKQVLLSVHNYASANVYLPTVTMLDRRLPRESWLPRDKQMSWQVSILAYLEGGPLYGQIARDKTWDAEENRFAALTYIPPYQCPQYLDAPRTNTLSPTNYIGITGLGADSADLPLDDPRAGCFGFERVVTLEDITSLGGTTNLLAILETTRTSESWTTGGQATARGMVFDGEPVIGNGALFGEFGHNGAHGAMANGTVRFFASSTDRGLLKRISTIQGDDVSWPD